MRTHRELDPTVGAAVRRSFETEKPDYIFLAEAKLGGILANDSLSAQLTQENLAIRSHVIHEAWRLASDYEATGAICRDAVGLYGVIVYEPNIPNEALRTLDDSGRLWALGCHSETSLWHGLGEPHG